MKRKRITFLDLFRKFISYYKDPDLIEEQKSEQTITNYTTKYKRVMGFLSELQLAMLPAENFDLVLANKLYAWMRKTRGNDYSVRTAELCENVLSFGCNKGYIKNHNLHSLSLKKSKPKPPMYLTPEEVALFEGYNGPRKQYADMFLFQCYTGVAFIDLMSVTKDHIQSVTINGKTRQFLIKNRGKTTIEANIPYFEKIDALWRKYNYNFKKMSGNAYRGNIKLIAKEVGITKKIVSHTGRKTCAMIKLNYEGYGIAGVSKILGHASIKTTETYYAKVELTLLSRELDRLGI
jgi:integrase